VEEDYGHCGWSDCGEASDRSWGSLRGRVGVKRGGSERRPWCARGDRVDEVQLGLCEKREGETARKRLFLKAGHLRTAC
jgi:hypothetical protein